MRSLKAEFSSSAMSVCSMGAAEAGRGFLLGEERGGLVSGAGDKVWGATVTVTAQPSTSAYFLSVVSVILPAASERS